MSISSIFVAIISPVSFSTEQIGTTGALPGNAEMPGTLPGNAGRSSLPADGVFLSKPFFKAPNI